ncbi:GTP-binding protein [Candidatus Gracilibacteria bacterium]|nr:GTP-binding protein [Candidatus Gracilibacteria bacterium]NJM88508.1 GTP-binding protein [Hydrococcus sp. RU_2_2]
MTRLNISLSDCLPTIPKTGMPVTIITGFLGSGKTTLLNHILENKQGLKVAILINEFGDINIDSQLLVSSKENMLELSNGCICCTINESLVETVYQVLEREDRIDYLIIETTGLADPFPIILTFLGTELKTLTQLDSIVTVVDSETFTPKYFDSNIALRQIKYGDIIILNKIDRVDEKKIKELENFIREIKAGVRIVRSHYGQVPLALLLGVGLTQEDIYISQIREFQRDRKSSGYHIENDGFVAVSFESDRPFELQKLENFIVEQMPHNVFRAKGILWFSDREHRHIFQLSGNRYEIEADEWQTKPKNQLVLIGRNLDTEFIHKQLTNCLTSHSQNIEFVLPDIPF